jgi:hypothetical protein
MSWVVLGEALLGLGMITYLNLGGIVEFHLPSDSFGPFGCSSSMCLPQGYVKAAWLWLGPPRIRRLPGGSPSLRSVNPQHPS